MLVLYDMLNIFPGEGQVREELHGERRHDLEGAAEAYVKVRNGAFGAGTQFLVVSSQWRGL